MEEWYVYILECSDKTYYVGITNNLVKRIGKHNSGKGAKYTRGRIPVEIRYFKSFESRSEASKYEYVDLIPVFIKIFKDYHFAIHIIALIHKHTVIIIVFFHTIKLAIAIWGLGLKSSIRVIGFKKVH